MSCLSSCSYIKPQLIVSWNISFLGCLSSCSYIKPQLVVHTIDVEGVVYHLVPTSNHNFYICSKAPYIVVYHLVPTSNHNYGALTSCQPYVVYHLVPTSNHNTQTCNTAAFSLFIILFLHQTTTPTLWGKATCVVYHLVPTSNHNSMYSEIERNEVVYHLVPTSNHNSLLS